MKWDGEWEGPSSNVDSNVCRRLEALKYDLTAWRRQEESRSVISYEMSEGFAVLDMEPNGGWDLVCQVCCCFDTVFAMCYICRMI